MEDSQKLLINQILIEEYVERNEYLIELFIDKAEVYTWSVLEKGKDVNQFDHNFSFPAKIVSSPKIHSMIHNVVNALEINYGPVSITIMMTESNSIYLLVISANISRNLICSHIIQKALQYDYTSNLIRATFDELSDLPLYHPSRNIFKRIFSSWKQ